jgi:histidyl-tRNA synthetase
MPSQFDPPSGTRDYLADDMERREHALSVIRSVYTRYGFEPLQTPAIERLDVLLGKYGDEGDKLVFKILRRGEHEASGEADLGLRYDMTVPLARVAAAYGSQLPTPYKRYTIGPVWRADRPGKDRYREFVQVDLDTLGSQSRLADAEALSAQHDALAELGLAAFTIQLNSRRILYGLQEAFGIPAAISTGVLTSLDKLDKLAAGEVIAELEGRGLAPDQAGELVSTLTAPDAADRVRVALTKTDEGMAGLDDIDTMLALLAGQVPADRVEFTPRMARGLSYYTGPIWEVVAPGVAGSICGGGRYDHLIEQLGGPDVPATGATIGLERILALLPSAQAREPARLDVAVTVMRPDLAVQSFALASSARAAGLRASVYLATSGKLGRQLRWANDSGARWAVIYGEQEHEAGAATVRDMRTGEQVPVPVASLGEFLARAAARANS